MTNNGKYFTEQFIRKQSEKIDRKFGKIKNHKKNCIICGKHFIYRGRENTKGFERSVYCSVGCAHFRGKSEDWAALRDGKVKRQYRTVCWSYHEKKCIICKEPNVVEAHHFDGNKKNNAPENFIPLCPTHHRYIGSRFEKLIIKRVNKYRDRFIKKMRAGKITSSDKSYHRIYRTRH